MGCIDKLMKNFDDKHCSYLNCAPIKEMCMSCKSMKSGKTKKSRKSRKTRTRR